MVIDFHTHVFPPEVIARRADYAERDAWFGELYSNPKAKMATVDDLLASMEADGVDVSVACAFGWRDQGLIEECDSYLLEAIKAHRDRIVGLAGAQPLAAARAVREIERCAQGGMRGVGELMPHGQGYRLSDTATLAPLMEAAQTLDLFVLTHCSEPLGHLYKGKGDVTPADLAVFAAAFPNARIVASHWGGGFPFYELMPEVRAVAANVWYDSAASLFLYAPQVFDVAARAAGAQKLLWASDYPLIAQRRMLEYARASGRSEADLALALGGNAAALLGLKP
ncbi:MAG TPA: amidohydrolase family protein [Ktedonobacterales bacterium]